MIEEVPNPPAPREPQYFARVCLPVKYYLTVQIPADASKKDIKECTALTLRSLARGTDDSLTSDLESGVDPRIFADMESEHDQDERPIFTLKNLKVVETFDA
jgi:hypothetical protein